MTAELEVELHLDACTSRGTQRANGFLLSARCFLAVQCPSNRLENGRLAGAIRADDAREAGVELDERVDVLPEVRQPQAIESHYSSAPAAGACVVVSRSSAS